MVRIIRRLRRAVPTFSLFFFLIGLLALCVHIAASRSTAFADSFNGSVSAALRVFLAHLTAWIPFSLAEFLLLGSPVLIVVVCVTVTRRAGRGRRYFGRVLFGLLYVAVFLYAMFVFVFGAGYRTTPLDKRLGIDREKVRLEELEDTARIVVGKLNEISRGIVIMRDDGSVRPYSHAETVEKCLASYEKLSDRWPFLTRLDAPVKEIILSDYMTYTHISGIYTFFTGEANLNTNYPYFVTAYTTAHEMAHQRGVAREDEANFMAFLVCAESDDPFLQYAGYLNLYEYLYGALTRSQNRADIHASLDARVRYDLYCYSVFFDRYRENTAAAVSSAVNDAYLVLQGTQGEKSYGLVVDLAVAYYRGARDN